MEMSCLGMDPQPVSLGLRQGPELGLGCSDPATVWALASVIPGVKTLGASAVCNIGALPLPATSSRPEKCDGRYRYDPLYREL